jgi:Xaa-Pro dipeptidase
VVPVYEQVVDYERMMAYRLGRAQEQLRRHGLAAAILFDPDNVRYTTTIGIALVWNLHAADRWVLIPAEGEPVLWEYGSSRHVTAGRIKDTRNARQYRPFGSGALAPEHASAVADELVAELDARGIRGEQIGVDRADTILFLALQEKGLRIADVQYPLELARAVKSPDEIAAIRESMWVCDHGIEAIRAAAVPGKTENEIWAAFAEKVISLGAEYLECRLLTSGPRTNPWFNEATDRVVEDGDFVSFDTDLIGPHGYLSDVSRSYLVGDKAPTDEQRRLYAVAYEFIHEAMPKLRPGASFEELGRELGPRMPEEFHPQRYPFIAHGSGLCDEYPGIVFDNHHPGEIEENMVLSVEAYVGAVGGRDGVKLEEQILITEDGYETLSSAPFDDRLVP